MNQTERAIDQLRDHKSVVVQVEQDMWLVVIENGDYVCEISVPRDVFEWFVEIRSCHDPKVAIWKDWNDHYGAPDAELDIERADMIVAFIARVSGHPIREVSRRRLIRMKNSFQYCDRGSWRPLEIWEEEPKASQPGATDNPDDAQ